MAKLTKEEAYVEAMEILQDIKGIVSDLNAFCAGYNLLPVETVTSPFVKNSKPKQVTSILQISCECDEQLGLLKEAQSNDNNNINEGETKQ